MDDGVGLTEIRYRSDFDDHYVSPKRRKSRSMSPRARGESRRTGRDHRARGSAPKQASPNMSLQSRDQDHRMSREHRTRDHSPNRAVEDRPLSTQTETADRMNEKNTPLRHGWVEMHSNRGEVYFYNNVTRASSWNRPVDESYEKANAAAADLQSPEYQSKQTDLAGTRRMSKTWARAGSKETAGGNEWWKDQNTPFKSFRRAYSSLRSVETEFGADEGETRLNVLGWTL
jgi:hypothetical protein